eukprot:3884422-Rhodomonas_salina.1
MRLGGPWGLGAAAAATACHPVAPYPFSVPHVPVIPTTRAVVSCPEILHTAAAAATAYHTPGHSRGLGPRVKGLARVKGLGSGPGRPSAALARWPARSERSPAAPVSYTHLTLPTICSV